MSYDVLIRRRATKQLADLPLRDYERVKRSISALGEDPRPQGCLKLTIQTEPLPCWTLATDAISTTSASCSLQ
jgi:mRNA-degrading endonuclease RelE of RelBE toxin-antitoxin system